MDGVEQQPERGERLRAVLHAKTKEQRPSAAGVRVDHRAVAGDRRLAFEPAAQERVLTAVARDNPRARSDER